MEEKFNALNAIKNASRNLIEKAIERRAEDWIEDNLSIEEWGVSYEPDDIDPFTGRRLPVAEPFYPSANSKNEAFFENLEEDKDFLESLLELADCELLADEISDEERESIFEFIWNEYSNISEKIFEEKIDDIGEYLHD